MAYTTNPFLPRVRGLAVRFVREHGWSVRKTARYIGVQPGTISKWLARAPSGPVREIATTSSRPRHSPRAMDRSIVDRILALRAARGRCAEIIHAELVREGATVSLSTVKRTLAREGLLRKRSPWKHRHRSEQRPRAETPGMLVEMDTVHLWESHMQRTYVLTLIDCSSRWAYAFAAARLNSVAAVRVVERAQRIAPFSFQCIQTDHGSEFSIHFTRRMLHWDIQHRHIRIRQPNDNAHIERFNRTIQEELHPDLTRYRTNLPMLNHALKEYLCYYNTERLHLGIGCRTPSEMFPRS